MADLTRRTLFAAFGVVAASAMLPAMPAHAHHRPGHGKAITTAAGYPHQYGA